VDKAFPCDVAPISELPLNGERLSAASTAFLGDRMKQSLIHPQVLSDVHALETLTENIADRAASN
jgi:hypothetical protein